jgi:hypothetical protein
MRAALVVALVWTTACGDDGGGFGVGNIDIEDAPEVARRALCHHAAVCGLWPDEATCLAANFGFGFNLDPSLVAAIRDGRVKYDGRILGDCYEQFGDATCDSTDADGRHLLLGCYGAIAGTIGDGGACSIQEECISAVCNIPQCPDACCAGTCVGGTAPDREAAIGEACGNEAVCGVGSWCASGTCAALDPADTPCTSPSQCDYGLSCAGTPRTCRPLPLLGEACPDRVCRDEGQYCNTTSMTCTQFGLPGDACSSADRCSIYYDCDPATMQCVRGAAIGDACTSNSDCFDYGTYCKANVCAPLEASGGPCAGDNECASNFCSPANLCGEEMACP